MLDVHGQYKNKPGFLRLEPSKQVYHARNHETFQISGRFGIGIYPSLK